MDNKVINSMRAILRYSPKRAYFGKFVPQDIYNAYRKFKRTEKWDDPVTQDVVNIGSISGAEICNALWNQASYNPKRFGNVSPFTYNGKEDIKHFYQYGLPKDFPGYEIWEEVRKIMGEFFELNGDPHCEENGVIDTNHGMVRIKLVDGGFTNVNYQKLSKLTKMIRVIITQNLKDVKKKTYCGEILQVMLKRHTHMFDTVIPKSVETQIKPALEEERTEEEFDTTTPYEWDNSLSDEENERVRDAIENHWRKTGKMLSVDAYKAMEMAEQAKRFVILGVGQNLQKKH